MATDHDQPDDLISEDELAKRAEELLARLEHLPLESGLTERYLDVGRRLLSDEIPERLELPVRDRLRQVLGIDPEDVRIHVGEYAQEAAEALGARAFTFGTRDVYFGKGQYAPGTAEGQALLAHELTHVYEDQVTSLALSTHDDAESTGLREGEAAAAAAESRMMQAAAQEAQSGAAAGLSDGDKRELVEKVAQILATSAKRRSERRGQ